MTKSLYTGKEVAERLGIAPSRVRQLSKSMYLGTVYGARLRLYTEAEVEQMAARNTKPGPQRKDVGK
jgi:hypothetical protein